MDKQQVKVFTMYLPQYHEIKENSEFWGKGFTDWVTVKSAVPLFPGHVQPKKPLNNNYYDLSEYSAIKTQQDIAKKYGVDGWGIYHYWFNSDQCLLTKPAEIILSHDDLSLPFFFAWDNASWKRTWSNLPGNDWSPKQDENINSRSNEPSLLIEYKLGNEEDWKKHFQYLLPYFKDKRYVKHKNRPLFIIYNYSENIDKMMEHWNNLAIIQGFSGIEFVFSYNPFHGIPKSVPKFTYEPLFSGWGSLQERLLRLLFRNKKQKKLKIYNYDKVWKNILHNAKICKDSTRYYGAFVNYDDTPRRGKRGKVIVDGTPEKFQNYLKQLIAYSAKQEKEYIFLTAWNEWGEGAMLEPDQINKFKYLEAYYNANHTL